MIFENPRRGRQARNFSENDPKILDLKSSSEQIIFRKLSLGAPDFCQRWLNWYVIFLFLYNPCGDYFVQVLFMSRITVAKPKTHVGYIALEKPLLHKEVSILSRRKPCKSCEMHVAKRIWLRSPKYKTRHARGREESLELYSILWSDWPTSKQKVSRHGNHFAARVRRRYFSEGERRRPKIRLRFAG